MRCVANRFRNRESIYRDKRKFSIHNKVNKCGFFQRYKWFTGQNAGNIENWNEFGIFEAEIYRWSKLSI